MAHAVSPPNEQDVKVTRLLHTDCYSIPITDKKANAFALTGM